MRRAVILLAAMFLAVARTPAAPQDPAFTTEFLQIYEQRAWHEQSEHMQDRHTCDVVLRVHGQSLRDPAAYANLRVDVAVDDTGTLLVDEGWGLTHNAEMHLLRPGEFTAGDDPSVKLDAVINPALRRATRIVRFSGSVQVRAGGNTIKTVQVPKLGSLLDQPVANDALKAQRLELAIRGGALKEGKGYIGCNFSGNVAAVRHLRVADAKGVRISESDDSHVYPSGNDCYIELEMPRPPDDRMTLQIDVVQDQKVITVPFSLHDIPLP